MTSHPEILHHLPNSACTVASDTSRQLIIDIVIKYHKRNIQTAYMLNEHMMRLEAEENRPLAVSPRHDRIVVAAFQFGIAYSSDIYPDTVFRSGGL